MLEANTVSVRIYIAGDYEVAKEICREWVQDGGCVTVTKTEYIYTGGQESGVIVGLINYPPYPKTEEDLRVKAFQLAEMLRFGLYQKSWTVECPNKTYTLGRDKIS